MAEKLKKGVIPDAKELSDLYASGMSMQEIGALYGREATTVGDWFKKVGIKARSHKETNSLIWRKFPEKMLASTRSSLAGRSGANSNLWKGGKIKDKDGYIRVMMHGHPRADGKGYVGEHVLVMEQKLGRSLTGTEEVHHINHIRDDNRPENLILFASRSEHLKFHHTEPVFMGGRRKQRNNPPPKET